MSTPDVFLSYNGEDQAIEGRWSVSLVGPGAALGQSI
jgi:hypothetical protein